MNKPRKWTVGKNIFGEPVIIEKGKVIGLCFLHNGEVNLMAAAPELFDALDKAYLQILEFLNEGNFKRDIEFNADYIVNALAKALGGSDK